MRARTKSRFVAAGLVLAVALTGAAGLSLAQDRQSDGAFIPEWQGRLPRTGGEYPHRAMERNIGGAAVLCCGSGASTSISCRVADERPSGQHFGLAALRISERLNLTPTSAAKFRENPEEIELTFIFSLTRGNIRIGMWDIEHSGVCRPAVESPTD
jgi:hypothetical protein